MFSDAYDPNAHVAAVIALALDASQMDERVAAAIGAALELESGLPAAPPAPAPGVSPWAAAARAHAMRTRPR